MDAVNLCLSGEALFGAGLWKERLRSALGVDERTFRRWLAGAPIPRGVSDRVFELLAERRRVIDRLIAQWPMPAAPLG